MNKFTLIEGGEKGAPAEEKKRLRASMKKRRAENENRDVKEQLMVQRFYELGFAKGNRFFIYRSYSSEARTDLLIERLQADGKEVYCPRVEGEKMVAVLSGEEYSLSAKGIREPIGNAYEGDFDVIIAPLLAIDKKGNRLGYGGGYYDAFIQKKSGKKIGYCYDFQVVQALPKEVWDVPMDGIITDKRWIDCTAKEKGD